MVTININDKKYRVPERLTIQQYQAALQFDWEDPKCYPMIVAQLIGAPLKQLTQAPEEALVLAIALVVKTMNDRTECDMIDVANIKFGEFVDMDVYLALGLERHLEDIAAIICPKAKWADEVMWAIDKYVQFRTYTYKQYKVLFGLRDQDIEKAEQEGKTEVDDKMQVARSWYKVIVGLAGEDILKIDEVTEQPLTKALNFMALQKEKVMEENERQLQKQRQYDLQRNRR